MTSSLWRTALVVLLSAVAAPAAGLAAFAAAITWSGCFLSCEEPDRVAGGLLWLLVLGLLSAGPVCGWFLLRLAGVARAVGGLVLGAVVTAAWLGVA